MRTKKLEGKKGRGEGKEEEKGKKGSRKKI